MDKIQVVLLGAGYGGLNAALKLQSFLKDVDGCRILLIDQNDYHELKSELYHAATGRKRFEDVTVPLRDIIKGKRIDLMRTEIAGLDFEKKLVVTPQGEVRYDKLVIALGSEPEFFGIRGLKEHAFTLFSLDDASRIQDHVQKMLLRAKDEKDKKARETALTFVVGGGGFIGVELAAELALHIPKHAQELDIDRNEVRLIIVEAESTILPGFDTKLVRRATEILRQRGIRLMLKTPITAYDGRTIRLKTGGQIEAKTLIWTGGARSNRLIGNAGLKIGPRGRVIVNPFLESIDYRGVYVIGDCSLILDPRTGRPLAPSGQLAMQQAKVAAFNIYAELTGRHRVVFVTDLRGQFISLGERTAVGWIGKFRVYGFLAWFLKRLSVLRFLYTIEGIQLMMRRLWKVLY